jgi:1,5-anhydro-D-fructose reductase (1,5-anhydro-D-mannitol-forming)
MEPLHVLVVGHGLIGAQRAAAIHALGERLPVRLAATVDPVERPADLYGGAPHHADLSEVDLGGCDAAVIALPHGLATEAAAQLLAAGRPILIEKPLGLTAKVARAVEGAAAAVERPSFVGYNYRFLPNVRELFAAIDDGRLGELRTVDMLIGHGGNPGSAEGWKLRPEQGGGGVLLDPGVHLLDLLLQLDADLEPRLVEGTRGFWETDVEEDLVMVFRDEMLLATARVSHIRWVNTLRIEVIGSDGYVILEGRGGTYGPMTTRIGRRWAWQDDPEGRAQRVTEEVQDHGLENLSLEAEMEAVLGRWLGEPASPEGPHPATLAEGRRITELAADLYKRLPT